jgi:hypothetical protein
VDNSDHIIELLSILASEPMPSQGFELPENEFEDHQKRRHKALREIARLQGNPVVHKMLEPINREMPADGGTRDQVLYAGQQLSSLLLPVFRRAQAEKAGQTNYRKFLRKAGDFDPFLGADVSLTKDAYAGCGETEPDTWAQGGGLSLGLGVAGEAIGALKPGVKEIAGETMPVRSQESGTARAAENIVNSQRLQKFDVQQTQPAAKRAIGNVASDVTDTARSRALPNDSQAAISKLQRIMAAGKVEDFNDAAKAIKAEASPVFRKLDDLTANEEMKFSDWQKSERSARSRGDFEAATKARSAQENLIQKYADHFNPDDLSNARANWRQASALEDIHTKLNTKGILQPTPEALRKTGVPDPGVLNGKAFSKQILALRENGSLKAAGLTPEHIQSLEDIGTLMERGNVSPSQFSQVIQLAGKFQRRSRLCRGLSTGLSADW